MCNAHLNHKCLIQLSLYLAVLKENIFNAAVLLYLGYSLEHRIKSSLQLATRNNIWHAVVDGLIRFSHE